MYIVYSADMAAKDSGSYSPNAHKPRLVAEAVKREKLAAVFVPPRPVTVAELALAHDRSYVESVLAGKTPNGFGNTRADIAATLPFTSGAMLTAAELAIETGRPAFALCSGFHHAGYQRASGFCTFNGLMAAAAALRASGLAERVAIIDCDQHYGDGTDDIIRTLRADWVFHETFGKHFHLPSDAKAYLERVASLGDRLREAKPDVILYQAGADAHVDDPLGGVLTTEQMRLRDATMFLHAKTLGVPIAFNLAGGYQRDGDGGISKVIELHLNTARAALEVFGK